MRPFPCDETNLRRGSAGHYGVPDRVIDQQQLVNRGAALEADAPALGTALRPVQSELV